MEALNSPHRRVSTLATSRACIRSRGDHLRLARSRRRVAADGLRAARGAVPRDAVLVGHLAPLRGRAQHRPHGLRLGHARLRRVVEGRRARRRPRRPGRAARRPHRRMGPRPTARDRPRPRRRRVPAGASAPRRPLPVADARRRRRDPAHRVAVLPVRPGAPRAAGGACREYIHEALVTAYIQGASHRGLRAEDLAELVAPWITAEGQPAFYRQIEQTDERYLRGDPAAPGRDRHPGADRVGPRRRVDRPRHRAAPERAASRPPASSSSTAPGTSSTTTRPRRWPARCARGWPRRRTRAPGATRP